MNGLALAVALALAAPAPSSPPARRPGATASTSAPPPTQVQAATADYLYRERRTILTGQPLVTFIRDDATLVCRRAVAYNDAQGDIQHAVCEGDVKLTRGERIVTCNRATFEAAEGRVVCRGDPVLHDGATVLRCEEVVYDLDQDRVLAKQVKGTIVQKPGQALPVHGKAIDGEKSPQGRKDDPKAKDDRKAPTP
ncbi:MAG TPA: LptA/OstA family protein [Anaeromyxobacteraceae bacterium]|nr:LptA/OstA family protein [Anaeromyxobacteraceae bacterium]